MRLHNPSILAMRQVPQALLSPFATSYAVISYGRDLRYDRMSNWPWKNWPDIHIAALASSGYAVYDCFPKGWLFNSSPPSVVRNRMAYWDTREFEPPLVLFYHTSGDEAAYPTFFIGIPYDQADNIGCIIGVYGSGVALDLEPRPYLFNLSRLRHARVPLSGSRCVVLKLRESWHLSYLTISIEESEKSAALDVGEEINSAYLKWIEKDLPPIRTSFRRTYFDSNQTPF